MVRLHPRGRKRVRDPPPTVGRYGEIAVLLGLLAVVETFLNTAIRDVYDLGLHHVTHRTYGILFYSAVGVVGLVVALHVHQHSKSDADRLDDAGRTQLLLALAVLIVGVSYVVADVVTPSASEVQRFVVAVLGTGGLAVGYLRLRSNPLRLGVPSRDAIPAAITASMGPVLLVLVWFVAWAEVGSLPGPLGAEYPGPTSALQFGGYTLFASVCAAFGAGLLFHGAIQETLRSVATPSGAVAGVTVLVSLQRWLTVHLLARRGVTRFLGVVVSVVLVILVAVLVVQLRRYLDETLREVQVGAVPAAALGVVTTSIFVGGWVVMGASTAWFGSYALVYAATVAVAAVTYERTHSVWIPMLAIGSFYVTTDVVIYLL